MIELLNDLAIALFAAITVYCSTATLTLITLDSLVHEVEGCVNNSG